MSMLLLLLAGCQGPPEAVELGEVRACASPAVSPSYTEAAQDMGFTGAVGDLVPHIDGGGLGVADLDDDGLDDVVLIQQGSANVWWNKGARFTAQPLTDDDSGVQFGQANVGDIDGDGVSDLILAYGGRQDLAFGGQRRLRPEAMHTLPQPVWEVSLVDLDGDGDLDAFPLTRHTEGAAPEPLPTLWNEGGVFVPDDAPFALPFTARAAFDATWFDVDDDLLPELYVNNDMGHLYGGNQFFNNEDGLLYEAGADCLCAPRTSSMGASVGDLNADGVPDLFIANALANQVFIGLGDGTYVDVTASSGAQTLEDNMDMSWGAAMADLDNDGLDDLLITEGDGWTDEAGRAERTRPGAIRYMINRGEVFEDLAPALGLEATVSPRAVVPWDFNADGALDLLISDVEEPPQLWLSEGCTAASWLEVRTPIPARVELELADGVRVRQSLSDDGYAASHTPRAWFGLGEVEEVERLTVTTATWSQVIEGPFEARRVVTVRGPE